MPTLRLRDKLSDLSRPQVMGILNVTPDSFYAASRISGTDAVRRRADDILAQGGSIIDVGAYSSRPGAADVDEDEEMRRLALALEAIRTDHPDAVVSIDTFRSGVARRCVSDFGADIINDISGGELDDRLFATVAELRVPYVLTHSRGLASTPAMEPKAGMADREEDADEVAAGVARFFAERLQRLYDLGVADVILDPGYGFGKTLEQNYALMGRLADLVNTFPDCAFLVGISRKSMIYRLLGTTPEQALNGTTVLNTLAIAAGAHILRVHDVREAVEAVSITQKTLAACSSPSD